MAGAGAIRAGQAYVEAYLDDDKLKRQLASTTARFKSWGQNITTVGASLAGVGAAITGSLVKPLQTVTSAWIDAASAMVDASERTGVTVEALSALKFAAEQSGASFENVEAGLKGMAKFLDAAAQGGSKAVGTLDRLGLSVEDLMRLKPDERFSALAEALSHIDDDGERAALAMKVFGKSGVELLPLLNQGAAGLAEFKLRAQELGIVMDGESAAAAETFGDTLDQLKASLGGILMQVGAALIPELQKLADWLLQITPAVGAWMRDNKELVIGTAKLGAALIGIGASLAVFGKAVSVGSSALAGLEIAMKANQLMAGKLGPALLAITLAALVIELLKATDAMREFYDQMAKAHKLSLEFNALQEKRDQATIDKANAIEDPEERKKFIEQELETSRKELQGAETNVRTSKERVKSATDNVYKKGTDIVGLNTDADLERQNLAAAEERAVAIKNRIAELERLQASSAVTAGADGTAPAGEPGASGVPIAVADPEFSTLISGVEAGADTRLSGLQSSPVAGTPGGVANTLAAQSVEYEKKSAELLHNILYTLKDIQRHGGLTLEP